MRAYIEDERILNFVSFEERIGLGPIDEMISLPERNKERVSVIKKHGENIVKRIAKADIVIPTKFLAMVLGALFEKKQIIYAYNNRTTQFADIYGFKTYPVIASSCGKEPVGIVFEQNSLNLVSCYAELVQK